MSDAALLQALQQRLNSDVATNTLLFPRDLCQNVSHRLETARLVINENGWLTIPLEPMLAEANPNNMWAPGELKKAILAALRTDSQPVTIADYLRDYQLLYNSYTRSNRACHSRRALN